MHIALLLDRLHFQVKHNKWLRYFTAFNRISLALGFLPSGFVKIMGERFTALSANHPMGHYLEALHLTGHYYTFIGIMQITAAILLLIPRTATLGAIIYFPIILNICVLSLAVRFDGSLLSSPLMVLANLYLLCWDYDKLKLILPFNHSATGSKLQEKAMLSNKFPAMFFTGVIAAITIIALIVTNVFNIMPRNTLPDCEAQCKTSDNPEACYQFCDCIHNQGRSLDSCLEAYNKVPTGVVRKQAH